MGGGEKEPEDFKAKKKQCLQMKEGMLKCEKAIKVWLEGANKMSTAAASVAEVSGDTDADLTTLTRRISEELGPEKSIKVCKEAIESIQLKIKMVDRLKKDCGELDDKRLVRNRLKRKSDDANKKDDQMAKEKFQREYDESVTAYNQLFAELDGSFDFMIEESGNKGGVGLAKPEMDTFKKSTCDFFATCAGICSEITSREHLVDVDLMKEWRQFNDRKDLKIDAVRDRRGPGFNSEAVSGTTLAAAGIPQGSPGGGMPPPPPPPPGAGGGGSQYNLGGSQHNMGGSQYNMGGSQRGSQQFNLNRPAPPPPAPVATAPPPPMASNSLPQARALYDYAPENSDELAIKSGDVISILKQEEDGWWEGSLSNGMRGLFPSNYVELMDDGGDDDYQC